MTSTKSTPSKKKQIYKIDANKLSLKPIGTIFETNSRILYLSLGINVGENQISAISSKGISTKTENFETEFNISDAIQTNRGLLMTSTHTQKLFLLNDKKIKVISNQFDEKFLKNIKEISINGKKYYTVLGSKLHILNFETFEKLYTCDVPNVIDFSSSDSSDLYLLTKNSVLKVSMEKNELGFGIEIKPVITNLMGTRAIIYHDNNLILVLRNCVKILNGKSVIKTLFYSKNLKNSPNKAKITHYIYKNHLFLTINSLLKIINLEKRIWSDIKQPIKSVSIIGDGAKLFSAYKQLVIEYIIGL